MTAKPLRCRLGVHAYVSEHPTDERLQGPDNKVCRLCGKHPMDVGGLPPAALGGGPASEPAAISPRTCR